MQGGQGLSQRETAKKTKVDNLYEKLEVDLGITDTKDYNRFELRYINQLWYVNVADNVALTKKNSGLQTVNVIKNRLAKVS